MMSSVSTLPAQDPTVSKVISNVPEREGVVDGDERKLKVVLAQSSNIGNLTKAQASKARSALNALCFPNAEKSYRRPGNEPVVFGVESLLPIVASAAREEAMVHMNIGMIIGSAVSPMLPAYVELGLQRLRELHNAKVHARLRVFSAGSVSVHVNGDDVAHVRKQQEQQRAILHVYIERFHSDIAEHVDLDPLVQHIAVLDATEVQMRVDRIRAGVPSSVLDALLQCGYNHGGQQGSDNSLDYAAYHTVEEFFQDEGDVPNIVSIGGPGEVAFNTVRFGPFKPQKHSVGIVVPESIISRTPPYLDIEDGITMAEFVQASSERIRSFFATPKDKRHKNDIPGARDLMFMARAVEPNGDIAKGMQLLRDFYESLAT